MFSNLETTWLTELNLNQLNDVKQLLSDCNNHDKGSPNIYPNSLLHTRLPAVNGLIYFQHKLVAFISAYFFYQAACESSLMVSPDYRQRGLAKNLLNTFIPLVKSQQMDAIYFSASQTFEAQHYPHLSFYSCEYKLVRKLNQPMQKHSHQLHFRVATLDDVDLICRLDRACFSNQDSRTMVQRVKDVIASPHYLLLIGDLAGESIAKAHIQWQQKRAILSDIAVLPEHQRQGFGTEVIHTCLLESEKRGFKEVVLEVESNNERALKLYLNQDFKIVKATNFWKMKI